MVTNVELVDWTGRAIRSDKCGAIDAQLPPIAQRLKIDPEAWTRAMRPGGNVFGRAIGPLSHLRMHAKTLGQAWVQRSARSEADVLLIHPLASIADSWVSRVRPARPTDAR